MLCFASNKTFLLPNCIFCFSCSALFAIIQTYWRASKEQTTTLLEVRQCITQLIIKILHTLLPLSWLLDNLRLTQTEKELIATIFRSYFLQNAIQHYFSFQKTNFPRKYETTVVQIWNRRTYLLNWLQEICFNNFTILAGWEAWEAAGSWFGHFFLLCRNYPAVREDIPGNEVSFTLSEMFSIVQTRQDQYESSYHYFFIQRSEQELMLSFPCRNWEFCCSEGTLVKFLSNSSIMEIV